MAQRTGASAIGEVETAGVITSGCRPERRESEASADHRDGTRRRRRTTGSSPAGCYRTGDGAGIPLTKTVLDDLAARIEAAATAAP
jgi:hypothetical protein